MTKKITGAIFATKNANPKAPSFKGIIEVNGDKIPVVLWKKKSKIGVEYYSILADEREVKQENGAS